MTRVVFVCTGNICRSPTAEAVLRHLAPTLAPAIAANLEVDSAGTTAFHVGQPPDPRSTASAARRGIVLTGRARQITHDDFARADLILAVDEENLARLRTMQPAGSHAVVRLLDETDVPDPYYGGPDGFDDVLDQVTAACERLLAELRDDVRQG